MRNVVLLSFDVEEFDLPKEHGADISLERGIEVSTEGLERILKVLEETKVKATFFCTGNYAKSKAEFLKRILNDGHEIACHGVDHFSPKKEDISESKKIVEKMIGYKVVGYRQPRMQKIDYAELKKNGYKYDSSVNPAFIPGRYNHLNVSRKPFLMNEVWEIPTSVATGLRVPLFWLALHLFPVSLYVRLAKMSIKKTGYFATYFHPWEFADLGEYKVVPRYIKMNSGKRLEERLRKVIIKLQRNKGRFLTYSEYALHLDKD